MDENLDVDAEEESTSSEAHNPSGESEDEERHSFDYTFGWNVRCFFTVY
jgi:hypothetical protein